MNRTRDSEFPAESVKIRRISDQHDFRKMPGFTVPETCSLFTRADAAAEDRDLPDRIKSVRLHFFLKQAHTEPGLLRNGFLLHYIMRDMYGAGGQEQAGIFCPERGIMGRYSAQMIL